MFLRTTFNFISFRRRRIFFLSPAIGRYDPPFLLSCRVVSNGFACADGHTRFGWFPLVLWAMTWHFLYLRVQRYPQYISFRAVAAAMWCVMDSFLKYISFIVSIYRKSHFSFTEWATMRHCGRLVWLWKWSQNTSRPRENRFFGGFFLPSVA